MRYVNNTFSNYNYTKTKSAFCTIILSELLHKRRLIKENADIGLPINKIRSIVVHDFDRWNTTDMLIVHNIKLFLNDNMHTNKLPFPIALWIKKNIEFVCFSNSCEIKF